MYDFGQLNNATEKDYTRQILKDRCHVIPEVTSQMAMIESVADVLAWSQQYMRAKNVKFYLNNDVFYVIYFRMHAFLLV